MERQIVFFYGLYAILSLDAICFKRNLELKEREKRRQKMIQDIGTHEYHNEYKPVPPKPEDYLLYYEDYKVLMHKQGREIEFPRFRELEDRNPEIYGEYTYLFSVDGENYYLGDQIKWENLQDYTMENKEIFRETRPLYKAFAGVTGYQLYHWYQDNHFCGRCGTPLKKDKKERMLYCENCHNMVYPKLSPAVIIGITDGNRILMSQYVNRDFKKYALIAGFAEIGETLEDTVRREVMEEVGLKVKNIRYYKSQPWSFTESLLAGFYCDLDGDDTITLEEDELAMAQWFEREEIPVEFNNISLTNEMIVQFKEGRE